MQRVTVQLPEDLLETLDSEAERDNRTRSELIREKLASAVHTNDSKTYPDTDQIQNLRDRLDDRKDDLHAAREQQIRAEARRDHLEAERARLEEELSNERARANKWENRYSEANGKLKVHTSEKGITARAKAWMFGK